MSCLKGDKKMRKPVVWAIIGLGMFASIMIGRDNIFSFLSWILHSISGCTYTGHIGRLMEGF
jgi:hypothetical protein